MSKKGQRKKCEPVTAGGVFFLLGTWGITFGCIAVLTFLCCFEEVTMYEPNAGFYKEKVSFEQLSQVLRVGGSWERVTVWRYRWDKGDVE